MCSPLCDSLSTNSVDWSFLCSASVSSVSFLSPWRDVDANVGPWPRPLCCLGGMMARDCRATRSHRVESDLTALSLLCASVAASSTASAASAHTPHPPASGPSPPVPVSSMNSQLPRYEQLGYRGKIIMCSSISGTRYSQYLFSTPCFAHTPKLYTLARPKEDGARQRQHGCK